MRGKHLAREQFIIKRFQADSLEIVNTAVEICDNYARQGYDLSLRQLYYQFVSKDLLANTEQNYKRLGGIISDARLAGLIDWNQIKDRGRECVENSHWDTPADILDACAQSFRIDTWADQPNFVCVMVEKQALEGVLLPVCRQLDIPFMANKGYSSSSALYEIGQDLQKAFVGLGDYSDYSFDCYGNIDTDYFDESAEDCWSQEWDDHNNKENYNEAEILMKDLRREYMKPHPCGGRKLHVIYLGDHDPSGIDMTRDVRERLELFSGGAVDVRRVALNMDQVRQYNPPENPAKLTDSRATDYIKKFGSSSWELDALEPSVLASTVRNMVLSLRDDDLHAAAIQKQNDWKAEIKTIAERFKS